jgi:signal transduction histidine kinase
MAARAGHPEYLKDLSRIYVAGHHLLDLINDILDLSKVEAGQMDLLIEDFDPGRVALEVLEMVTPLASRNSNRLDSNLPTELPRMKSDAGRLRQVLLNLLGNACKFTHEGKIDLRVTRDPSADPPGVIFEVRDTGIGMTPEQLGTIFRPFAQADATTARRYGGTGLGLSIARTMAERLGGRIEVTSEIGKSSTFTLHVPLTPNEAPAAISVLEDSQPVPGTKA